MASTKYSTLPDIDSAADIYETPDSPTGAHERDEHSEEEALNARAGRRNIDETSTREDMDRSRLPNRNAVDAKFRKAEKRRGRFRDTYTYPSPSHSPSRSPSPSSSSRKPVSLQLRLQSLKRELEAVEKEMVSTEKPEPGVDADEIITELSAIRGRVNALGKADPRNATGQALVARVTASAKPKPVVDKVEEVPAKPAVKDLPSPIIPKRNVEPDAEVIAALDRRLEELEVAVGASSASLDESSPLPQPLLPQITKLSNLLTLLTQPRHIDSVSRRLKILITELERYSSNPARRPTAAPTTNGNSAQQPPQPQQPLPSSAELAPILNRLSPALPLIPHLITRLRTLSTLHASASSFASTLGDLEEEQRQTRAGLSELGRAVEGLEKSLEVNAERVEGNLSGLLTRLEDVQGRLEAVGR